MRFAVLLLLILCGGCHSVKHEWFPDPQAQRDPELGGITVDVVRLNW